MKPFSLIFLAVLTALTQALANLGDGSDKIDDAYGNLVQRRLRDDGTVTVVYHKDRYVYQVVFANDRSISETYFHVNGTDLSEKEIMRFLKANGAAAMWMPGKGARERSFKRSDGNVEVMYGDVNGRPALTVRELRAKNGQHDQ